MNIKDITWNEVNGFSQIVAIVLFIGVFGLGFMLGMTYEFHAFVNAQKAQEETSKGLINDVVYVCDGEKTIEAVYTGSNVDIFLPENRHLTLPQAQSASGTRYANTDESVVFLKKGTTAYLTEEKKTTFANCKEKTS